MQYPYAEEIHEYYQHIDTCKQTTHAVYVRPLDVITSRAIKTPYSETSGSG